MSNPLNLKSINQEEASNLCRFYIASGQNMLMLGRRGIAKTAIAIQSIQAAGYKVNYINLSVIERNDLAGYPMLFDKGDLITYKSPYYLPPLQENQKPDSVLLFDELDKAAPETTAPLLEIAQFKTINGKKLNAVSCIFTGNLLEEGAYGNVISSAILDRTSKYILEFNFDVWVKWARENQIHPLILAFLISNPELAIGKIETTEYASPSPRSWSLASEALIKAHEMKITDIDTITNIIAGFVGLNAAISFEVWYKYSRKYESEVLSLVENGIIQINYNALEPTEQLVFIIMACNAAKMKILNTGGKKRTKGLDNICRFFVDYNVAKEMQTVALMNCFPFDMIVKEKLYESKLFFNIHRDLTENVVLK